MLGPDRQARIVQLVQQHSMSVVELSQHFGVSAMTIRRDLDLLEARGLVLRVHGGARAPEAPKASTEDMRGARNVGEKEAIGAAAAALVEDGQTLFIDAGTTTIELARRLRERQGLTVITNSVRVLGALADCPAINLIGLGGSVYGGAWSFVGPLAEAALRRFNAGVAFMGITSLSLQEGLSEINYFEAAIKSTMIQRAQRVILLADHTKFEKVSPVSVAPLSEIDTIITDGQLSADLIAAYRKAGVEIMLATPPTPDAASPQKEDPL